MKIYIQTEESRRGMYRAFVFGANGKTLEASSLTSNENAIKHLEEDNLIPQELEGLVEEYK